MIHFAITLFIVVENHVPINMVLKNITILSTNEK